MSALFIVNGTPDVVRFEPGNIAADGLPLMVGDEINAVIRSRDQSLGDRSHADCFGFFGSSKVGMADPAYEDFAHRQRLTIFLYRCKYSYFIE